MSKLASAMRAHVWPIILATGLLLCNGQAAFADETESGPGGPEVPEEVLSEGEKVYDVYEERQKEWSEYITSTATYMDSFFDTEQYSSTSNKTYLRVRVSPILDKNGLSFSSYVDLRLQLPNSEKWLLNLGGDPDAEAQHGSTPMEDAEKQNSGTSERNAYAGINTFFKRSRTRNVGFGGGVRFRNRGIAPYIYCKWTELWEFDNWDLRGVQRFRYNTDDGLESKTQMDVEWPIAHRFYARTSGSALFKKDDPTNYYDVNYTLYHFLTTRRALRYQITTGYLSEPNRSTYLSSTQYDVEYRQQWRDWFSTSLIPYIKQNDANNWKVEPGIRLDFNVILGHMGEYEFKSAYTAKQESLKLRDREKRETALQEAHEKFLKMKEEREEAERKTLEVQPEKE